MIECHDVTFYFFIIITRTNTHKEAYSSNIIKGKV